MQLILSTLFALAVFFITLAVKRAALRLCGRTNHRRPGTPEGGAL